jgi:Family of unknown function (DUF5989)
MSKLGTRVGILGELLEFLRSNKKLWLTPVVVLLVLVGVLVVAAETSAVAPFIYTLF